MGADPHDKESLWKITPQDSKIDVEGRMSPPYRPAQLNWLDLLLSNTV
jgi:hypothetical protein